MAEPDPPAATPVPGTPSPMLPDAIPEMPVYRQIQTVDGSVAPPAVQAPKYKWYHKLLGLFAVIFCFELGVFLLVFPWASDWDLNYFSSLPLWASTVWASPYFRGAISGLGVLNIYVSFIEVFRLRRFSASSSSLS